MDGQRPLARVTPPTYKIIILGDTNVGKSSLFLRYLRDEFRDAIASTIAISNDFKEVLVDGHPVHLQIWDTAGQERYKSIVSQLYRDADGFILVYDVNSRRSFSGMKHLMSELGSVLDPRFTVLVGNKTDCVEQETLREEAAILRSLAQESKIRYFLTSAKTGENVCEVFEVLSKSLLLGKTVREKPRNAISLAKKRKRRFCF